MDNWKLEQVELMSDAMEEVKEWNEYEADIADMIMEDYAAMVPTDYEYYEYEEQVIDDRLADYFDGDVDYEIGFNPYMGCYDYDC